MKPPVIKEVPLLLGDDGVLQTVIEMRKLARAHVNDPAVQSAIRSVRRATDWESARAAFDLVVRKIPYQADPPGAEQVASARLTLGGEMPFGDCDDQSVALATLCLGLHLPVWLRTLSWRVKEFTHVHCIVELPSLDVAIPCDTVMGAEGFGNQRPELRREEFYPVHTPAERERWS